MKSTSDLQFKKISLDSPEYGRCYRFWKSSWERTFQELAAADHLPILSDGFVYRTKNCLFAGEEPVGIYLTETIPLEKSWQDHSYFQMYSPEIRERLFKSYRQIVSLSYIAVAEAWRKSETDIPLLELVFGLGAYELLESGADALVSCVRKNRKVDSAFSCYSASSWGRGSAFNVEVEYMVLERNQFSPHTNPLVQRELNRLWTKSKGVDYESAFGKGYQSPVSNLSEYALGK
jgi:hypothetical protein